MMDKNLKKVNLLTDHFDPLEFNVIMDFSPENELDSNSVYRFNVKAGNTLSDVIEALSVFIIEILIKTGG